MDVAAHPGICDSPSWNLRIINYTQSTDQEERRSEKPKLTKMGAYCTINYGCSFHLGVCLNISQKSMWRIFFEKKQTKGLKNIIQVLCLWF